MKKNLLSKTKAMGSNCFLFLCMAVMALVIFATPNGAYSTDRLIVTDPTGSNTEFAAADNGTIRLNSNTLPATAPSWALIYGSSSTVPPSNTGYALDSYGSPVSPATTVTAGGGGTFRFARGTQAAPTSVGNGDRLGFFLFSGYDGSNWWNSVGISAYVDNTVSTGNVPSKITFETLAQPGETPSSGGVRMQRLMISSKGYVAIGGDTGSGIPTPSNPLQVGNAYVTPGGQWTSASSRAYKENINTLTTEEANQALDGLSPVKYNYKTDKEEKHVGFIAEDVPDLVATKDRKGLSALDIVAVLTKVVQEQKNTIAEQTNMISELSKKVDAMQKEINRVKGMNIVGSIGE